MTETERLRAEIDRLRAELHEASRLNDKRLGAIGAALKASRRRRAEIDRLRAENQRLRDAAAEVSDLIRDSTGVAGLHNNGEIAPWSELLPGGEYESWLLVFGQVAAEIEAEGDGDKVAPKSQGGP